MVRITGGEKKGFLLKVPRRARPTSARVRQSIFSLLGEKVRDAVVLDLFCGSGALGIEALSRGALFVVFVDSHREAVECTRQNLKKCGYEEVARVDQRGFVQGVKSLKTKMQFDVIFADPPYGRNALAEVLKICARTSVLKQNGVLVVEHRTEQSLPDVYETLRRYRFKRFGGTSVSFYRKEG